VYVTSLKIEDIPEVVKTADECELCPWSAAAYAAEIRRGNSIMLKLSTAEGQLAGFAVGRVFDNGGGTNTAELLNIGIREPFRNQGLGLLLLRSFIRAIRERSASTVMLEVRRSNAAAIRFYRLSGFEKLGVRRGFYSDPDEDAITMRLTL
jgi:ribosomal-protein-alanine N-acetyltransferase